MNIELELSYRVAMLVENRRVFPGGLSYPICPRCHITMERDFQNFCDRCGQKLAWRKKKNNRNRVDVAKKKNVE